MFCNECGAQLKEGVKFCINCGTRLEQPETQVPEALARRSSTSAEGAVAGLQLDQQSQKSTVAQETRVALEPPTSSDMQTASVTTRPPKSRGARQFALWGAIVVLLIASVITVVLLRKSSPSSGPPMSDAQIATAVSAKISADPILSKYGLLITCNNGDVTLIGSVNSEADKTKAAAFAAQLNSVRQVNISGIVVNGLVVTAGAGPGEDSSSPGRKPVLNGSGVTTITVPANQPWTATGILLHAGDVVTISATGTASMGAGWPPMPPAGRPPDCDGKQGFPAPQLPCWSLIGRVGQDGAIFAVGSGTALHVPKEGELFFGVNDDQIGDNSGNWTATVALNGATTSVTATPESEIRKVDFCNFSYESHCSQMGLPGVIPVRNGHWDNGASQVGDSLNFSVGRISYGDVKGDGKEEAVVPAACQPPANFDYEEIFVFEMSEGSPKLLALLTPGQDIASHGPRYEIVKVGEGELDVSYQANGEHGYGACSEWTVTQRLHWNGNSFVNAGESRKKNSCALMDAAQDAQTASAVQARINADPMLRKYHLLTTCGGGVVTLTGSVNSEAEKRKAAALAAHVKNVVSVNTSGVDVNGAAGREGNIPAIGNPPTISLQANPTSISPGQQVTLTWQSTNATSVSINGMPEPPTGSQVFTPPQPITYQAVATGSSGQTASAVAVIIVKQPLVVTLSAGTPIRVRMNSSLDSGKVSSGTTFRATLDQNLLAGGQIVAPAGAEVDGRVVVAKKAGILGGTSELALELSQIHIKEQLQPISTNRFDSSAPGGGGGAGAQLIAGEIAVNDAIYSAGEGGITKVGNAENTTNQVIKILSSKKSVVISSGVVLQFSLQQPVTLPPR